MNPPVSTPAASVAPCLLAFDTSTEQMVIAVASPAGVWTHRSAGGALVSKTLLRQAHLLLQQAGLALADLDAIAFGRGPGAFTGLRTSCAVAQGLAFGLGCGVLAIDSLLIVAEDAHAQALAQDRAGGSLDNGPEGAAEHRVDSADGGFCFDVGVAVDARMDEAYAARYRWTRQGWLVQQAPALYTLPALAAAWCQAVDGAGGGDGRDEAAPAGAPGALAGSALLAFGARLPWPAAARRFEREHDRAAALARLAIRAWADGKAVDAALALPLYLRDKVALTTREREAVRQTAALPAARG